MNRDLKTRLTILKAAIEKLDVFEDGTLKNSRVVVLQERLRLVLMEFELENLEGNIKL